MLSSLGRYDILLLYSGQISASSEQELRRSSQAIRTMNMCGKNGLQGRELAETIKNNKQEEMKYD